ncbi:MAG: putative Ig domain-containing protein, partial [Massilia sp.]
TLTNSGGALAITFNANATEAIAGQVLQSIKYANGTDLGNVQVNYTFSDGSTVAQGSGGPLSASGSLVLQIVSSDTTAPRITAIDRLNPTAAITNADMLTFRVTFSETVNNVSVGDFVVSGSTAGVTGVTPVGANAYDVTVGGGNLASYNGVVTLSLAAGQDIADTSANALTNVAPTGTDNRSYTLDNLAPSAPTVNTLVTTSLTPQLSGAATVAAGETLTVTVNGASYAVVPSGGAWTLNLATATPVSGSAAPLTANTVYEVKATVTDAAGNAASDSTASELNVVKPTATTATIVSMTRDTGVNANDFVTADGGAGRTVTGTLSAPLLSGEVVQVSFDGGATWNTAVTSGSGWTVTDSAAHTGNWTIQARVNNPAAASAGPVATQAVVLDTVVPAAPTVTESTSSSVTPIIGGTATANAGDTLTVSVNGATYTVVPVNGQWTLDLATAKPVSGTLGALVRGESYDIKATLTDAAGNSASDSSTSELRIAPPPAPAPIEVPVPVVIETAPLAPVVVDTAPPVSPLGEPAQPSQSANPVVTPFAPAAPASSFGPVVTAPFVPPLATEVKQLGADPVAPGGLAANDAMRSSGTTRTAVAENVTELQLQRAAELSDVYTRTEGFRTVVAKADEPALVLFRGVPDQYVEAGRTLSLIVPADAFAHTQPKEVVRLTASLQDGRALPDWVQFDAQTGKFSGEVPAGTKSELRVKVTARDSQGREATAIFRVNVGVAATKGAPLKVGLSDQLRQSRLSTHVRDVRARA